MTRVASDRAVAMADSSEAGSLLPGQRSPRPTLRQLLIPIRPPVERAVVIQATTQAMPDLSDQTETNWPAAIEMIRDVGARMRQARRYAQDVVAHSQGVVEGAFRRLEETERRLQLAEAAAQDALRRAEQAEAAARMADARARRAEEEAEATRLKLAEAQVWLRRLYSSVQVEFRELTDDRR